MDDNLARQQFSELLEIIHTLRCPDGCPWDRKQTHRSLIPFLLEESQEAVAAIEEDDMANLASELGDVLLQIVLHSEIASERLKTGHIDGFDINTVLSGLCSKLKLRHPHVFSDARITSASEVIENWHRIKASENRNSDTIQPSVLDSVNPSLSQLTVACKYQINAALTGFDWDNQSDVILKVEEELRELLHEIHIDASHDNVEDEIGDVLFSLVNLCRFLDINPEEALRKANNKFKRRFTTMEKGLGGLGMMKNMSLEELDLAWDKVKATEK